MYVKLIIGAGDQNLLTGTKWDVYSCPSFNFGCTTSIVKSLKRQTCKQLCKHGVVLKKGD